MNGYTVEEKVKIGQRHLLPKQLSLHGLGAEELTVDNATFDAIVSGYTREAGVRELERQIAALCRGRAVRAAEGWESAEKSAAEEEA